MGNILKFENPEGVRRIVLQTDEYVNIFLEDFSDGSRDFVLEIFLQGDRAQCFIKGRAQVCGDDRKQWNIKQICSGSEQKVVIELHGVSEDSGRLGFHAEVVVERDSVDACVEVFEHIWLFGGGQGTAVPILDVNTDVLQNVHHSASVAQVEESRVLFLKARGIAEKEVKNILKKGFLRY